MKLKKFSLPAKIHVQVGKGKSGSLIATLPEYDIFTQAEDLNELFFQVNDLIYTFFDVPKNMQNEIYYIPPRNAQENLVKIAHSSSGANHFQMKILYSEEMHEKHFFCA